LILVDVVVMLRHRSARPLQLLKNLFRSEGQSYAKARWGFWALGRKAGQKGKRDGVLGCGKEKTGRCRSPVSMMYGGLPDCFFFSCSYG